MGGRAFGFEAKRISREEFFALWKNVVLPRLEDFRLAGKICGYHLVENVKNKPDFGDMDVLIRGTLTPFDVKEAFGVQEYVSNGDVLSILVDGFQVDLVRIPNDDWWESAVVYYAYGDFGMLAGKIARFLGVRWGWQGLRYTVYNNIVSHERKLGEIVISTDPYKSLEFLGFDPERFRKGFETTQEMWDYIVQSKYFSKDPFIPKHLNSRQRSRDAKRDSYQDFLEYIASLPDLPSVPRPEPIETLRRAEKFFGVDISSQIVEMLYADQIISTAKFKFNGEVVMRMFGLEGNALGYAMRVWNDHFPDELSKARYILSTPLEEIVKEFERVTGFKPVV